MARIRIKRKKKPWLHSQTKQAFAWGNLWLTILKIMADYGKQGRQAEYERVRAERMTADTLLKTARLSYVIEQTHRLELLNQEKLLDLKQRGMDTSDMPGGSDYQTIAQAFGQEIG